MEGKWEDQLNNDHVSTLARFPQIPVGGRISLFVENWKKITTDKWVLDVVQNGYKLEFLKIPHFLGIKQTKVPFDQENLIQKEIEELLLKNAIEIVDKSQILTGFYSTLFLVPKKNGEMRPVINLKPLNRYLRKTHFKMDTMPKVLNLVQKGDYAINLDLKDGYFHVKMFKGHRKYLRFCFKGQVYQFRVLCFGPTSAPRVFCKIMSVIVAHLRQQGLFLTSYLDDWLAANRTFSKMMSDRKIILDLLFQLGLIVNKKKSSLVPSQIFTYIGGLFDMTKGLVYPTQERITNLKHAVLKLLQGSISAKQYMIVLGMIASCLDLIPNAKLFMRPIQLHLLKTWSPARMPLSFNIPLTPMLRYHLHWWLQDQNILKGRSVQQISFPVSVTTDASGTWGWGGHMNNFTVQGRWSKMEKLLHINILEMKAVILTVRHFLSALKNKNVLIRSDNTSVCQYINRQGGTRCPTLCLLTWELWELALNHNIVLKAVHIMGKLNFLADFLSRQEVRDTEWSLNKTVTSQIFNIWGQPLIDLFATQENKQTTLFCSWLPQPQAFALDALSIAWQNMYAYAFPPIQLIPKVLNHMKLFKCRLILIAPNWPRQHWFPQLLKLLIAKPIKLPVSQNLLSQYKGRIFHQNPQSLKLTAWLLSTKSSDQRDFLKEQEIYLSPHGEKVQEEIIIANLENSVIGVVDNRLIRFQLL
jgi:hypothetical protein